MSGECRRILSSAAGWRPFTGESADCGSRVDRIRPGFGARDSGFGDSIRRTSPGPRVPAPGPPIQIEFPRVAIQVDVCGPEDVDELVALLADVFTTADPPAVAVGLDASEFALLVELYRTRAGDQGLTMIARDSQSGALVGALLAEDSAAPFPEGVERLSPKFEPIFDILGQLDGEHRSTRPVFPGESVHLFLLGVSGAHARQGIAQRLVSESITRGAALGYRVAVTEATNVVSQHVFRKLGFVERARRSYGTFRYGGKAPFAGITEHGGPLLLERALR